MSLAAVSTDAPGVQFLTFAAFQASAPAREMFARMGIADLLLNAVSWRMLRALVVQFNDCDKGHFVARARRLDGVASSGERILLHAICYVCDFAWLADELGSKEVWQRMDRVSGPHRVALLCCLAAEGV